MFAHAVAAVGIIGSSDARSGEQGALAGCVFRALPHRCSLRIVADPKTSRPLARQSTPQQWFEQRCCARSDQASCVAVTDSLRWRPQDPMRSATWRKQQPPQSASLLKATAALCLLTMAGPRALAVLRLANGRFVSCFGFAWHCAWQAIAEISRLFLLICPCTLVILSAFAAANCGTRL